MQALQSRIASMDDLQLIAEISRNTFYDTYHAFNTKEDMDMYIGHYFNLTNIESELKNPSNTFLLVYDAHQLCGYAKLSEGNTIEQLKDHPVLEIARFYAVKEMIGKGVGAFLMNECINIAKQKANDFLWLIVWQENAKAISFYKKFGFEIFGEQEFILGKDIQHDWLMRKELR
jgi:ribosomal protein S18 acetylase RimI-like enzyme